MRAFTALIFSSTALAENLRSAGAGRFVVKSPVTLAANLL